MQSRFLIHSFAILLLAASVSGAAAQAPAYPNRPANYTRVLSDYDFSDTVKAGLNEPIGGGWRVVFNQAGSVSRVSVESAPVSPPYVLQWSFPGRGAGGNGVGNVYFELPSISRIYVAFSLWHEPGFDFNDVSNKLLYLEPGNLILETYAYAGWYSIYNGAWKGGTAYKPMRNYPVRTGKWERIEYLVDAQRSTVKVWVDGELRLDQLTPMNGGWKELKLDSTWGGGGVHRRASYRRIDNVFVATTE